MRRRKQTKLFHIGAGVKNDDARTSLEGKPNTNLDTYRKEDGKFTSRKKYGEDGRAKKDLDAGHYDHNQKDHAHDYNGNKRSAERENLTKQERRELNKAKKKRRFWDGD